ncbi:BaeS Signal transduction histidine kinase [uncultured Caudovirales phage]|uniref:BaeS Signal transduction histidine kinase n=1 Tax=uncultured Caudovirales phage TaxID=2100421 RepID=A0A6J5L9N4_9CAUD|nr:BaeS Signal transduction histidine kinase [uncultured Caudovirales phage]
MKKIILLLSAILVTSSLYSQDVDYNDTLVDGINTTWDNNDLDTAQVEAMNIQEIVTTWIMPEPEPKVVDETKLTETDLESIAQDLKFLDDLPKSYTDLPKEDLKNVLVQIDNKITKLTAERDSLLAQAVRNEELIKAKENTIGSLGKEKNIIGLTLETGNLTDANGNLINQKTDLEQQRETLKKYLYIALGVVILFVLILAVVLQRKRIQVQDVEIEQQISDIAKKNSYLEHAARIIRHDMHSGINTYMPRGITSLEKRLTVEDIQRLKIEGALKMVKEGLNHTQKVYKSVYEFTNLVKQNVVLNKSIVDAKDLIWKYISPNSYSSQVEISDLGDMEVNETLFCNAVENLIKNGLSYNDSEVKKVKIYNEEEYLIVEDNGKGFSQKQLEKHLTKYSKKADVTGEEKGLGLNICVAILEEHGFKLSCEKIEGGTKMKIKIK